MKTAMILAAGLGTRMRPLTETIPKPLVEVGGKPLLQYCLDAVEKAGLEKAVVNVHYLPDQIIDYLNDHADFPIYISDERDELLDSGGGITNALGELGKDPFLLLNADTFWLEDNHVEHDNLTSLINVFDKDNMDILLMLAPISRTTGHTGSGDFSIDESGRLARNNQPGQDALIYAGAAIIHPRIFDGIKDRKFSLNRCFDEAISKGRLFGHLMHGHWITVGTMDAIADAESAIEKFTSGEV